MDPLMDMPVLEYLRKRHDKVVRKLEKLKRELTEIEAAQEDYRAEYNKE